MNFYIGEALRISNFTKANPDLISAGKLLKRAQHQDSPFIYFRKSPSTKKKCTEASEENLIKHVQRVLEKHIAEVEANKKLEL
jgi:hypothetical protein